MPRKPRAASSTATAISEPPEGEQLQAHAAATLADIDSVEPSATNPRKHFDPDALAELTDSVRRHGVIVPVLVRPVGRHDGTLEIVAGERRWRAAKAAGLRTLPVIVRELDDRAALELQVIENLQRADLHPLEEAEGYRQLIDAHGYEAEQLAAKVGKSKAYIYARLKLCALPQGARKLFLEGKLDASKALLVARIPVAELAEQAARCIAGCPTAKDQQELGYRVRDAAGSYRDAAEFLHEHFTLRLKDAPFSKADATLVPEAGTCSACPKRTGNQPELPGIEKHPGGADVCTDPKCFAAKRDAHAERAIAAARERGLRVIDGKAGHDAGHGYSSEYVKLDAPCYEEPKHRPWRQVVGKDSEAVALAVTKEGDVVEVVKRTDALKAAAERGLKWAVKHAASRSKDPEQAKRDRNRKIRREAASRAADAVLAAVTLQDEKFWRVLLAGIVRETQHDAHKTVIKRHGTEKGKKYEAEVVRDIAAATPARELPKLGLELLLAQDLNTPAYDGGFGKVLVAACTTYGVDLKAMEKAVRAELAAKERAGAKGAKRRASTKAEIDDSDDEPPRRRGRKRRDEDE